MALREIPDVFPNAFPKFALMVASWSAISDMSLGQTLLDVLNSTKQSMGANWEQYYAQHVDIRFRQIIQNNFGFYSSVCQKQAIPLRTLNGRCPDNPRPCRSFECASFHLW